jgi:hypothetical protein
MLRTIAVLLGAAAFAVAEIPAGFTPIFNGKNLDGWHVSKTNHHGTTPDWHVENGVLVGTQNPPGKGGILLTDKKYKDFEVYFELKPDWGCDGGFFLRSSESGQAYQVMIDYLERGSVGGIYGEKLEGVNDRETASKRIPVDWQRHWKRDDWNSLRVRMTGEAPHITVWMNGQQIVDFQDTANHAANGAREGMLAVQIHFSGEKTPRWVEGGKHRYRVIAVRELP